MKRNMKTGFLLFVVIWLGPMVCLGPPTSSTAAEVLRGSNEANETALFNYLLPIVYSSGKAVRLYYRSDCRAATDPINNAVPLPFVEAQQPSKGVTGLTAIRQIFEKDKNVTVTEDAAGVIRIRIGKVSMNILQTKPA